MMQKEEAKRDESPIQADTGGQEATQTAER